MAQNPRTDEIRTPRTIDEADRAIDLCEEILDSIEDDLAAKPDSSSFESEGEYREWIARVNSAKKRWSVKKRELLYHLARLKAGESPLDIEIERLKLEVSTRDERIRVLTQSLHNVKEKLNAGSVQDPQASSGSAGEQQDRTG